MVHQIVGQDYGNMASLTEEVVEVNRKIATHRAHIHSPWTNFRYSEQIAGLEYIGFDKGKPNQQNDE